MSQNIYKDKHEIIKCTKGYIWRKNKLYTLSQNESDFLHVFSSFSSAMQLLSNTHKHMYSNTAVDLLHQRTKTDVRGMKQAKRGYLKLNFQPPPQPFTFSLKVSQKVSQFNSNK